MNPTGCAAGLKDLEVVFLSCPKEIKPHSLEGKENNFVFCVDKTEIKKYQPALS